MLEIFWQMLFLLAPAGIANVAPVFGAKIKGLEKFKTPVDLGYKFKGKRIFGDNKTWRGIILGVITGGIVGIGQTVLVDQISFFANINLADEHNLIILGLWLGLFALIGDLLKSFVKRQSNIKPGKPFFFFDQADYVLGSYLILPFFVDLTGAQYLMGLFIYIAIHPFMSYIGYCLKLKKDKF